MGYLLLLLPEISYLCFMRNNLFFILIVILLFLPVSCKKNETPETSGIVTIDNIRTLGQTYYVYGFLFSEAKKVSTLDNPRPDITVDSDGLNLLLMADNLKDSFYKAGEYNDGSSAGAAFDNLKSATIQPTEWEGLANPLKENQIWIYRSGTDHYAKIRIITLIAEIRNERDYAECTFEWEYQPDGSLTFPGK
jgi:hypothetical protein